MMSGGSSKGRALQLQDQCICMTIPVHCMQLNSKGEKGNELDDTLADATGGAVGKAATFPCRLNAQSASAIVLQSFL